MAAEPKKVLIAEDDQFISKIMKFSLEEAGYQVDHVPDGVQAMEKIHSNDYAIILSDLIMPKKDGFEILKELQESKSKTIVLVFSNLSQEEDKKEALSLGAKEYFVKSDMAINEVVEKVKEYLEK